MTKNKTLFSFVAAIALSVSAISTTIAAVIVPPPPEVNAQGHILLDFTTGHVISEQNADIRLNPASLTKMMTLYVIGQELKTGNINLQDLVTISENAWAKNFPDSSKMFIEVGTEVSVEDLIHGIVVQSGNDACVAMAEHIAGSESAFATMMNSYAAKLGMTSTNYVNSHGLHEESHYTSPRDMSLLAKALISDVPNVYKYYSVKEFTYNGIKQYNRNSLLWDRSMSVDGIKTGYTSDAGYSLITSGTQDDMRLISVVMGTESERARKVENKKLLKYGFRFYETITPYTAGESFVAHRIYMGDRETVDLGITVDTPITIPRGQRKNLQANFELNQKLEAPLEKGEVVGTLFLQLEGEDIAEYPLVTLQSVAEGGFISRMTDFIKLKLGMDD